MSQTQICKDVYKEAWSPADMYVCSYLFQIQNIIDTSEYNRVCYILLLFKWVKLNNNIFVHFQSHFQRISSQNQTSYMGLINFKQTAIFGWLLSCFQSVMVSVELRPQHFFSLWNLIIRPFPLDTSQTFTFVPYINGVGLCTNSSDLSCMGFIHNITL